MYRIALPCTLAVVLALSAAPAPGDDKRAVKDALTLQEAFQNAIQEAEPSIACILVSRSEAYHALFREPLPPGDYSGRLGDFDPKKVGGNFALKQEDLRKLDLADPANVPESYGSGVVIDEKDGLILTNRHVVHLATKIYVRLPGGKGSYADIHADDPRSDLAVLRLRDRSLKVKAIKLGDGGKARKGQLILTLANPFAAGFRDGSPSASYGIISNIRRRATGKLKEDDRDRDKTLHHYGTLLQLDARLNLGCSGGALIDLKGELIGLTSALAAITGSETAGGFAVPMDAAMRRIVEVLRAGKEVEYGFLGVGLKEPRPEGGAVVQQVTMNSPAFAAGLKPDEVIVSVNGTPVRDNDELFLALGTLLAGTEAALEVRSPSRGGLQRVTVTLAKFYVPARSIASNKLPPVRGLRVDYASILAQSTFFPPRGFHSIPNGVAIREVAPNSPADKVSLRVNEVITHVNGQAVNTPADFYREAQNVKTGPLKVRLHETGREVEVN